VAELMRLAARGQSAAWVATLLARADEVIEQAAICCDTAVIDWPHSRIGN
jgi:thymidine kinase